MPIVDSGDAVIDDDGAFDDDDGKSVIDDDASMDVGVGLVFVIRCDFTPATSMAARQHARAVRAMFRNKSRC